MVGLLDQEGYELPHKVDILLTELSNVKQGSVRLDIMVGQMLRCTNSIARRTTDLTIAELLLGQFSVKEYSIVKSSCVYRCIIDGESIPCATAPLAICATLILLKH